MKGFVSIIACLLLVGCANISIPDELLITCPVHEKVDSTLDEAIRLANARLESIEKCNERILKIKQIVD